MGYDMTMEISALNEIFVEFYYWITVPLMFLIHVGFCLYEVSISRAKNHMHTLMKNAMLIPMVTITMFLFGFWIYFAGQGPFGDFAGRNHRLAMGCNYGFKR